MRKGPLDALPVRPVVGGQPAEAVAPHRSVHSVAQLHALVTGLKGD